MAQVAVTQMTRLHMAANNQRESVVEQAETWPG